MWAVLFYSFPALLVAWETDLGWSKTQLTGAYSLALILSAVLAPGVGRLIDKGHARPVFVGCTLLGTVGLLLLSTVQEVWQFYATWALLGIAMAGLLYEACFALLTRCMGALTKRAITLVTLVAGFAGTLAFPGTHALLSVLDWRGAVVAMAAGMLVLVLPLVWIACRAAEARTIEHAVPASRTVVEALWVLRRASFWFLALSFAAVSLDHSMLLTHLLPLLDERSVPSATAVLTASLIGPMQVAGRLLMLVAERHISAITISAACFLALVAGAFVLFSAGAVLSLLIVFAFFQGAANGVESIVRPVITAELLGRRNFGVISGLTAVAIFGASAAGPLVGALAWGLGGYDLVIWLAGGAAVLGLVGLLLAVGFARQGELADRQSV